MKSILSIFLISSLFFISCTKDKTATTQTLSTIDAELYGFAKNYNDSIYFANVDSLFQKSAGSGHPQPYLKVKYNAIAGTMLNANGKVVANASFPEGALIIKELYDNTTSIGRYAMLYKKSDDPNADAKGWVWGYIDADGDVAVSALDKGQACINCHSQSGNIDYTLMNQYFP